MKRSLSPYVEYLLRKLPNHPNCIIFLRLAGVRCTQIKGYVKGERCEPGDVIDEHNKSYWLAVYIGKRTNIAECIIDLSRNYFSGSGFKWNKEILPFLEENMSYTRSMLAIRLIHNAQNIQIVWIKIAHLECNVFSLLTDGCWRLMDVYWAALCVHGGRSREWVLLDDCGTVKKETDKSKLPQPRKYVRRLDETYFLTDPQKLIYRYRL